MMAEASPKLSLSERDRRYSAVRQQMSEKGIACVIVDGSDLFYLTNGIPGELYGVLSADETPLTVVVLRRYLIDIPVQVLVEAQDWVQEFKPGMDAGAVLERVKELGLGDKRIGMTAGLSYKFHEQLKSGLPGAELVQASDIFANVRTCKSEEENGMIDKANRAFDAAIQRVHEIARPGMLGSQVVQEATRAMWEAGGDLESTLSFNFGPVPAQNPALAEICLRRKIQEGDIGTLTAHALYGHYAGHSDQEICFGQPKPLHREMFEAVLYVREGVLAQVKPGATQRDLINAYQRACKDTGFKSSPHSQIHQYGIDVPEFPGTAYRIADSNPQAKGLGSAGNFVIRTGMIYSISPTVVAQSDEDLLLGGTSLIVTETGYREHGERKVEMLVAA